MFAARSVSAVLLAIILARLAAAQPEPLANIDVSVKFETEGKKAYAVCLW